MNTWIMEKAIAFPFPITFIIMTFCFWASTFFARMQGFSGIKSNKQKLDALSVILLVSGLMTVGAHAQRQPAHRFALVLELIGFVGMAASVYSMANRRYSRNAWRTLKTSVWRIEFRIRRLYKRCLKNMGPYEGIHMFVFGLLMDCLAYYRYSSGMPMNSLLSTATLLMCAAVIIWFVDLYLHPYADQS